MLLALAIVGVVAPVGAAPPEEETSSEEEASAAGELMLSWSAPEGCPTQETLQSAIDRYLGGAGLSLAREVRADAKVTALEDGGFRLALLVETGGGTSVASIDAERCELLVKAAALKIAVTVDPLAVLDTVEAEPPAQPQPPPEEKEEEAAPIIEPEPEPEPEPPPSEPKVRGAIAAQGLASYGVLPNFGAGVGLSAAIVFERWRFEAAGAYWPSRSERTDLTHDIGGNFMLGTAALRGCPEPKYKKVEFPLCLGVELGAMRGEGFGVDDAAVASRLWAAALLGLGVTWAFTDHLAVGARLEAVVALARPEFSIRGAGLLHQAGPAAPRGLVGLEVRF